MIVINIDSIISFLSRTETLFIFGAFFGPFYIIRVLIYRGRQYLELPNVLAVLISGSSILVSFRLIIQTALAAHEATENGVVVDQLYLMFGSISILWISIESLYKKMQLPKTAEQVIVK